MASCLNILVFTIIFLLFFFYFALSQQSSSFESVIVVDCNNCWIHIRRLPPRSSLDMLANCSEYPLFDDFCPYLANYGLGQKTYNSSYNWYLTDPLKLEYPCPTKDPFSTNMVFLPYYASLDALRYLYGPEVNFSAEHGLELYEFLQKVKPRIWNRHMGHDHSLVMAQSAWDFSQPLENNPPIWGTLFLELSQFFNVTALKLEARTWPWQDPIRFMRQILQASFCLQPSGDTPTRRSTFDVILAGCIPVFFEEQLAKSQYIWHLPEKEFETFLLLILKEDVVFKGLRFAAINCRSVAGLNNHLNGSLLQGGVSICLGG